MKKTKDVKNPKKLKTHHASIRAYASYVDSLADLESAPGCELCSANRRALERVWQTVSQEYYPPPGRAFSQRAWAARLPAALRASGGALRSAGAARAAARDLVASLGDRYTEYLGPEAYRAALRRPLAGVRGGGEGGFFPPPIEVFRRTCFFFRGTKKLTSVPLFDPFPSKKPKLGAGLRRGEGGRRRRNRRRGPLFLSFLFFERGRGPLCQSRRRPRRRGPRRVLRRGRRRRARGRAA